MSSRSRGPSGVGIGLIGTIGVHATAVAFVIMTATRARAVTPPTYAVRLVAAPDPTPDQRKVPDVVQREAATPPAPAPPTKKPAPALKPAPAPPPNADTKKREAAPKTAPVQRAPDEAPSTGHDAATISTEGQEFPYPEYLQNIISQVRRRWTRSDQALEAEVSFFIHKDGTVTGLQFTKRSGNFAFDLEAEGAVESAAQSKVFGALPAGWTSDVLFIRFYFSGGPQ